MGQLQPKRVVDAGTGSNPAGAPPALSIWLSSSLQDARVVTAILVAYCALHFVVRLLLSPNFSLDESEQVLFGESLQWGYRFRHPPLITWLTWATLTATNESRAAFFAMKYAVMAAGLAAYFNAARIVINDAFLAALATFGLLTTFVIGFLPHTDLMHSVALATMISAFLWAAARAIERGALLDYVLLGMVLGLGILSKYVFAILPLSFAVGIVLTPALRRRVRLPMLLVSVGVAAALVAPYVAWSWLHQYSLVALATAVTHDKHTNDGFAWLLGIGSFFGAAIGFGVPLLVIFPALYWRVLGRRAKPHEVPATDADWQHVYAITMLAGAGAMLASVLLLGSDTFKPRWMHQVLMPLPIYLFLLAKPMSFSALRHSLFVAIAALFALGAVIARFAIYETDAATCRTCREYWPMEHHAAAFRSAGFRSGTILTEDYDRGGNTRYWFPTSRVVIPGYPPETFGGALGGQCLVVWSSHRAMPATLSVYLVESLHGHLASYVSKSSTAPLHFAPGRVDALNFVVVPEGTGDCR